jgi:hypothetical protein
MYFNIVKRTDLMLIGLTYPTPPPEKRKVLEVMDIVMV